MIFAILILYPLCRRYYSMFVHVIAPVGALFVLGAITKNFGTFSETANWNGLTYNCMLRAVSEIALGAAAFEAARVISAKELSPSVRRLLTGVELGSYLVIALFMMSTAPEKYDIYIVALMMVGIALTFSEQVYGNELFNNRFCFFLGKASLPIYLSQVLPLDFMKVYLTDLHPLMRSGIMLMLTLLNAALCAGIVWAIGKMWRSRKEK